MVRRLPLVQRCPLLSEADLLRRRCLIHYCWLVSGQPGVVLNGRLFFTELGADCHANYAETTSLV